MKDNMSGMSENSSSQGNRTKKPNGQRGHFTKDVTPGSELWTNGLICAFEYIRGHKKISHARSHATNLSTHGQSKASSQRLKKNNLNDSLPLIDLGTHETGSTAENSQSENLHTIGKIESSHWVPIGWARVSELAQTVQRDAVWSGSEIDFIDDEDDLTVADLVAPYWEHPAGPVWWCHVSAGHPFVESWLNTAQWLHPAISIALRDESRLISDRMKHLLYEVPVRVAGGLLFELLGQSVGDPYVDEDDIPVVLRSWQAQNFLITVLHMKGSAKNINVLGITEVQELLIGGGHSTPRTIHEIIAHLASRLARWDDRLFRKSIFGTADELELKFMNRRNHEDIYLYGVILNQETRRLSRQVIRVKWTLHAREEIIFELLQHLRGNRTRTLLEGITKSTRHMIDEQEAVRGRLFTIQDVMQSTVRSWLQDKSLRVTHNLAVFGGCGLVLSIITGLFGINVDGMPGAKNAPYAFGLFTLIMFIIGIGLIIVGLIYLGFKKPISDEQVEVRKMELQELVTMFQHEAESHAQVRQPVSRHNLPPTAGDRFLDEGDYILIH